MLTSGLLVWALEDYTKTIRLVDKTHDAALTFQKLLANLLSTMKDAETGQRGFLITGEDEYLAPYQSALASVDDEIKAMRGLTADNPRQQQRLDRFYVLSHEKFAELS